MPWPMTIMSYMIPIGKGSFGSTDWVALCECCVDVIPIASLL